jgi:hypothetical protein
MNGRAQKLYGARSELNTVFSLETMLGESLVTMAWHILKLWMEGRPPDTEGSCKDIE